MQNQSRLIITRVILYLTTNYKYLQIGAEIWHVPCLLEGEHDRDYEQGSDLVFLLSNI